MALPRNFQIFAFVCLLHPQTENLGRLRLFYILNSQLSAAGSFLCPSRVGALLPGGGGRELTQLGLDSGNHLRMYKNPNSFRSILSSGKTLQHMVLNTGLK